MIFNRRKVLGAGIGAGLAGPSAAKAAIASINLNPAPTPPGGWAPIGDGRSWVGDEPKEIPVQEPPSVNLDGKDSLRFWRMVFANPELRSEYESALYERLGREAPFPLDPDIDVHRSFSLAAKVAYQRQRLVARHMASKRDEDAYGRILKRLESFFGMRVFGFRLFG